MRFEIFIVFLSGQTLTLKMEATSSSETLVVITPSDMTHAFMPPKFVIEINLTVFPLVT